MTNPTPRFTTERRVDGWTLCDGRRNGHGRDLGTMTDEHDAKAMTELLNDLADRAASPSPDTTTVTENELFALDAAGHIVTAAGRVNVAAYLGSIYRKLTARPDAPSDDLAASRPVMPTPDASAEATEARWQAYCRSTPHQNAGPPTTTTGARHMKKIVNVTEVSGEGLEALLGERITIFAANYIYTGNLVGVNATCVLLDDAAIVYETGAFTDKAWKDAQKLPNPLYVQTSAIESFTVLK